MFIPFYWLRQLERSTQVLGKERDTTLRQMEACDKIVLRACGVEYLLVQKCMENTISQKSLLFLWTFFTQPIQSNATLRGACLTASVYLRMPRKVLFCFVLFLLLSGCKESKSEMDKIPYKDYTIDSIFFMSVVFRKMFVIN